MSQRCFGWLYCWSSLLFNCNILFFIIQPPKSAQGKQKLSKAEKEKLKAEEEARKAEEEGKFIERKKNCF